MTLKEEFSSESLVDRVNTEFNATDNENNHEDLNQVQNVIISLFHQPYFQSNSLPISSPLSVVYNEPVKPQPQTSRAKTPTKFRGDWETPKKSLRGELIDQPVTFHSKIKSSGYGVADVTTNRWKQKKQINHLNSNSTRSKSAPRGSSGSNGNGNGIINRPLAASRFKIYPRDCGMLTQHQEYNNFPPPISNIKQIPILKLQFSGDGTMIGCISAGNDVCTLRAPLGRYKGDGLSSLLIHFSLFLYFSYFI